MEKCKKKNLKSYVWVFLLFGITFLLLNCISAEYVTCSDNPTQLWHFEEGTGITAQDSCYGYNITFYGDMVWVNGKYGNAVEFNGINTYLDAGNIYPFNQNMPEFSFSLWVNISSQIAWQTIFRSGYYNPPSEFIEAIQINEGDTDYVLFMGSSSNTIRTIDDGNWHNIIGTFNGTSQSSKLYIDGNFIVETFLGISEISATTTPLYFGYNFDNGFLLKGVLDEVAFFNRTLTQDEIININSPENVAKINAVIVSSYPYVDLNESYQIQVHTTLNNIPENIGILKISINDTNGTTNVYNFNWDNIGHFYSTALIFNEIGDYPFVIYPNNPYINLENIEGTFLVRQPFNVTFCGFNQDDYSPYENDYAYLIAEPITSKKYYDNNLEQFITPLGFATTYDTPVFHTYYRNGCGTLKLYELNQEYAIRLFDGVATYQTTLSPPNISRTYGTNIFFGRYTLNGTDTSYSILLSDKDIHQYRWLFNWIYIILLGVAFIGSIFLFFVIPQVPSLSLIFGLGFISMLTLIRIVLWIWVGW